MEAQFVVYGATVVVFVATCAGLAWLIGATIWSILRPQRRVWPPVRREGLVFHVTAVCALAINVELVALAVLGWHTAGLAVVCSSTAGLVAGLLATVWFLLLPFAEEPWLREKLGAPYDAYAARVPRYLPLLRVPRVRG